MQKVKMLSSQMGVPDGELHPVPFVEGEEYEVGPDLLQGFINLGAVELADIDAALTEANDPEDRETKVDGPEETKPATAGKKKK